MAPTTLATMSCFQPTYGWLVHAASTVFCLVAMLIFAGVWIPAGFLLELPLRFLVGTTLFPQPESFLAVKPGLIGRLGLDVFRDSRDWFKIYYTLYVTFILWPAALYMILYCNRESCLYQAGIYYVLLYGPRLKLFVNMFGCLHSEAHLAWKQGTCKPAFGFLNHHLEYALGTLAGHIPELTGTCHVKVHHTFSNGPQDTESVLAYNRLSMVDYVFKYMPDQFTTHALNIDGFRYFAETQNWAMWKRLFQGTAWYGCFALTVLLINPLAALFVVAIPLSVFNCFISVADWTQHTFLYKDQLETSISTLVDFDVYSESMHISHQ